MRKLIDTNVILRYLLKDNPLMSEEARQIIEDGAFTLPEVIAEVVYVLKGVYKIDRDEIGNTLIDFLNVVFIDNHEMICVALSLFIETSLDFVDCILIARHRLLGDQIASFDKKLNKML
jgi:predicted nucleic-acid-binding protein